MKIIRIAQLFNNFSDSRTIFLQSAFLKNYISLFQTKAGYPVRVRFFMENNFLLKILCWLNVFFFLQFSGVQSAFAQEKKGDWWYMDYNFINYDDNQLLYFQPDALSNFFTKLNRLESKKDCQVSVFQIGDSHIQADMFSGRVREKFMEDDRFPMSARGFVFPYSAARTNNPYNYKTFFSSGWTGKRSVRSKDISRWGISGITIETYTPGSTFSLHPNIDNFTYNIRKVKVFYPNTDPSSFDIVPKISAGNSVSGYFVGDGYVEFTFRKPQTSVEFVISKNRDSQSKFVLQGVTLENTDPGIIYSASGVNSADVSSYFRCQDFEKQAAILSPDLVVISLGTNDAYMYAFNQQQFKTNMRILVNKIRQVSPHTNFILTTPADNYRRRRYPNKNNEKARQAIFEVAREMGLAVWDLYNVMGGFESINKWYDNSLAQRDKLHFTGKGYSLQGELLYQAINNSYLQYQQYLSQGGK